MEEAVVRGQRTHHGRASGEGDQTNPVPGDPVDELGDVGLGTGETIRRRILGEHALRHVEYHHDVGADPARRDGFRASRCLGTHQCHDTEQQRRQDEHQFRDATGCRSALGEAAAHGRRDEPTQKIAPAEFQQRQTHRQRQCRPDAVHPVRVGEDDAVHFRALRWARGTGVSGPATRRRILPAGDGMPPAVRLPRRDDDRTGHAPRQEQKISRSYIPTKQMLRLSPACRGDREAVASHIFGPDGTLVGQPSWIEGCRFLSLIRASAVTQRTADLTTVKTKRLEH